MRKKKVVIALQIFQKDGRVNPINWSFQSNKEKDKNPFAPCLPSLQLFHFLPMLYLLKKYSFNTNYESWPTAHMNSAIISKA
jgi:hypothetical protein